MTTIRPPAVVDDPPRTPAAGPARFAAVAVFAFLDVFLLGALVFEVTVMYPDQFHDVPRSLEVSNDFMAVVGIGDFMRPAGMATVLAGVVALVAVRHLRGVRMWVGIALGVLVAANFVFSVLYFWPANTVMFQEGLALHTADELRAVASAFVGWNVVRIAGCVVSAVVASVAFVRFHELQVCARLERG